MANGDRSWHDPIPVWVKVTGLILSAVLSGFGGAWAGTVRATWAVANDHAQIENRLTALENEQKTYRDDLHEIGGKLDIIRQNQIIVLATLHAKYPKDVPTLVLPSYTNDPRAEDN